MSPVGPRASKEEFMQALGLSSHDAQHEQFYRAMRDETILIYNRLNEDPANLLDSIANDPSTKPPFFWHHIRPERQRWAIQEIARNAGPHTQPFFTRGDTTGEYGPNWVAGWLLYSVFRSRDVRNNRNRRKGEDHQGQSPKQPKQADTGPPKKEYYDPVRNE
ncbi:hypothetical protein P175DRAFT_0527714 [Aspergillus ochraceoroseus IBT 24754]|uniref:Uncharacterized protein n=2 Tax=Aspergillus ochraceoroseus TaxID=138278 RepID=A0A2T5M6V4_9EURO|nr:uncharacterized protein P175DRAFT_0527714 [Aspergillus ochraceoroseus IBT 24754]KKK12592.1 hypothetical protein AOCH_007152 [Aspergillus ochraceoroseus]PTU24262.1 hypothetical protein P175DRAFT_0527714 [Aspergillus ochraceoroseus IBT 24754]